MLSTIARCGRQNFLVSFNAAHTQAPRTRLAQTLRYATAGSGDRELGNGPAAAVSRMDTLSDGGALGVSESSSNSSARSQPHRRPASAVSTRRPDTASIGEQLRELKKATVESGGTAAVDSGLLPADAALVFPELPMTSLSGGTVSIADASPNCGATLVLLAFRSFADEQLTSWREPFVSTFEVEGVESQTQVFDVSINETFAAQMLSGFVQRLQRGKVAASLHEHTLALNAEAGENIEALLPSKNRLFGYALLLDRDGKVRFRSAGMATERSLKALLASSRELLAEDEQRRSTATADLGKSATSRAYKGKAR